MNDTPSEVQMPESIEKPPISADAILQAEFNYIAQTVYQAEEDRKSIYSFYVISIGTLVAAMISTGLQGGNTPLINGAFSLLLVVLSIVGLLTLLQLVRLRAAWHESMLAMNQIKEYYIHQLPHARLEQAIRWRSTTLPASRKLWSISFLFALQVAALSSTTLAAAVLLGLSAVGFDGWGIALISGLIYFIVQLLLYIRLLKKK